MLDDQELNRELTADDKAYLEEFKNVAILSFTNTKITSLNNFPDLEELRRIELNGNGLAGTELVQLLKYKEHLHTLKFSENNVREYAELEAIKELTLCNIDLSGNPIAEKPDYREKLFEIFEDLEVLDGEDKEGNPIESEDDGEEGEAELDEETIKRLQE
jgi:Ran GTPase-activating protein (RanGAP) involved in mRNA processing and transport